MKNRVAKVTFTNDNITLSENYNLEFSITRSTKKKENVGNVTLFNLVDKDSLGYTGGKILVECGYEELFGIHYGDVLSVQTTRTDTNYTTRFTSIENYLGNLEKVSINLSRKSKLTDIFDTIASDSGLSIGYISRDLTNVRMDNGYTNYDSAGSVLDQLALEYNFDWSCQDGNIYIIRENDQPTITASSFDYSSGLLEDPYIEISQDVHGASVPTWTIKTLLTPSLRINNYVDINSNTLNGRKKIYRITHTGNLNGDSWFSIIKVFE
jgi:hypothetical protein